MGGKVCKELNISPDSLGTCLINELVVLVHLEYIGSDSYRVWDDVRKSLDEVLKINDKSVGQKRPSVQRIEDSETKSLSLSLIRIISFVPPLSLFLSLALVFQTLEVLDFRAYSNHFNCIIPEVVEITSSLRGGIGVLVGVWAKLEV